MDTIKLRRMPGQGAQRVSNRAYIEAWHEAARPIEKAARVLMIACDPGFTFHDGETDETFHLSEIIVLKLGAALCS